MRQKLANYMEEKYEQYNYEQMYIEAKRDFERLNIETSKLKSKCS